MIKSSAAMVVIHTGGYDKLGICSYFSDQLGQIMGGR